MIFSDFYREIREFDAELAPGSETPLWSEFVAWSQTVALEDEDSLHVAEADRDFWHAAYDLLGQQADDIESGRILARDALTIDELLSQVS